MQRAVANPGRVKLLLAFAAIYLIWGFTFLAIRLAVASLPPLVMMGTRHLVAGAVLYLWMRDRGAERCLRLPLTTGS
jgi:drug/metabolite transporter (DMT)-like permease